MERICAEWNENYTYRPLNKCWLLTITIYEQISRTAGYAS